MTTLPLGIRCRFAGSRRVMVSVPSIVCCPICITTRDVCDIDGPLLAGELARATAWGRELAVKLGSVSVTG
jgi:hypothetical protein